MDKNNELQKSEESRREERVESERKIKERDDKIRELENKIEKLQAR